MRTVQYLGYRIDVPASWPVFRLGKGSTICARFNRHAVYLGAPSLTAKCPANPVGRTEAILIEPLAGAALAAAGTTTMAAGAIAAGANGRLPARAWPPPATGEVVIDVASAGVQVIATWQRDPGLVHSVLSSATVTGGGRFAVEAARATPVPVAHHAGGRVVKPATYTGLGFDLCGMPSAATLQKWQPSPYRAMNLYIGGANAACPQKPTPAWVSSVTSLGWNIIPTYVGLQAPSNECGCASIVPADAYKEGLAAARDAIAEMKAAGIGPDNPIYFDMEGYVPGKTNTLAVLTFLKAWSIQLHRSKYLSGVYSSADGGMVDLAKRYTVSTYVNPDDIWFALWNNVQSTALSTIPSSDWANHQRIHQFNGGENVTYGGVTMNIDGDYCDAQVVAASSL